MKRHSETDLDQAAELLSQLIAVPSVNPAAGAPAEVSGEARLAEFVAEWARRHGLTAQLHPITPTRPCVLIRVPAERPDAPTVGYFAHMDTVWTPAMADPFTARREGNRIFGLGACDDKGSLAAGLLAAAALAEGPPPPVHFIVCGTVDEESGFTGIRGLIPAVLRPDVAMVAEGTGLQPVVAHKGVVRWRVKTVGEAVHASLVPRGCNAIFLAARLVTATQGLLDELLTRPPHPLLGPPTLNVGVIRGGSQENSVPDHCTFSVERRLLPGETVAGATDELHAALSATGAPYTLHDGFHAPPFAIAQDHPWATALLREVRNPLPDAKFAGMTAATEAAHLAGHGVPTVVFGPGNLDIAHSPGESIPVDEILVARDIVISAIRRYTTC
jgi:acetylornithine deacetylase